MILLYTTNGCLSCRKAKAWLEERGLPYKIKNIESTPLTIEELRQLFVLSNGSDDLVSKRSRPVKDFYQQTGLELDDLSFKDLLEFLQMNPTALKRPIMTNGKYLQVGFDADEMTTLLPREMRSNWTSRISL